MVKSCTYNKTKELATQLKTVGLIDKCYLQAKKFITPGKSGNSQVGIETGANFESVLTNNASVVGYFRDISNTRLVRRETEGCYPNEYFASTDVRLVVFASKKQVQSNFVGVILSQLSGVIIRSIETNQYTMLQLEVDGDRGKIFADGLTVGVMIDFTINENIIYNPECPPQVGDCGTDDLVVC